jgi:Protein of unknown function (DUF3822)
LQSSTAVGYKLIKKIKDDRFDEENIHQYDLLVQLSVRDFQIGIVDSSDGRVLFFEDYVLGDLSSHQELLTLFQTLFESHQVLQAGFWNSVKVSIKNSKFVQVPNSLFVEEAASEYLKFNAHIDQEKEDVIFCHNKKIDAVTVFAVQSDLLTWLKGIYSSTKIVLVHQSSSLIEGAFQFAGQSQKSRLYIYVDRFKLHIISIENSKLIYYNQFAIKQFSDYVKYIMLVMKGLGMDQQTCEVILWGYISQNSPHYLEFVKYIRNVTFGNRPEGLKFGYIFDEVQEHHFFDLFSIQLLKP